MTLAWHFSASDKRLANGDGRLIRPGETLSVVGDIALCERGLHASRKLLDALSYAPGSYLWRVRLGGVVIHADDKSVASERTVLWGFDASDMLRHFARLCALDVIGLWDAPDVVRRYLRTGDDSLGSAAWSAAGAAAGSAAWPAAWSAARAAAWSAAGSAAWPAAWSAARFAAELAAESAAWSAARSAQQKRLARLVRCYARSAGVL